LSVSSRQNDDSASKQKSREDDRGADASVAPMEASADPHDLGLHAAGRDRPAQRRRAHAPNTGAIIGSEITRRRREINPAAANPAAVVGSHDHDPVRP
jgi:hypothetical protein